MGSGSPKPMVAYPKTLLPIATSVGGLALFLIFASLLLVYQPIGSKVSGYFYNLDEASKIELSPFNNETSIFENRVNDTETNNKIVDSATDKTVDSSTDKTVDFDINNTVDSDVNKTIDSNINKTIELDISKTVDPDVNKNIDSDVNKNIDSDINKTVDSEINQTVDSDINKKTVESDIKKTVDSDINKKTVESDIKKTVDSDINKTVDSDINKTVDSDIKKMVDSDIKKTVDSDINKTIDSDINKTIDSDINKTVDSDIKKTVDSDINKKPVDSDINKKPVDSDINKTMDTGTKKSVDSGCDLYDGKWVYDSAGPLYTNSSCPVLTQMENCQGNGRPDKDYENWRWKPTKCDLPRFDPKKFLELVRGKTLAFVGDSVARNQMESMLCILWQVEVPKNRGNKRMQRYYFQSTSVTIIRIWSSWLVHKTTEKFDFAPEGVDKLHLDIPDETFLNDIPTFDILVLSSGHWFAKRAVYILNNEIVGGQLWWPDKSRPKKIESPEAFKISVATIMSTLVTSPSYTGLTVVRSYSPDHYEGGAWNTGGSCTGKVKPAVDLVENGFTNIMHDKQVLGFNIGVKNITNKSRVVFMDITKAFSYRHDGHPGPYRSLDPNKVVKRSADGRPPPQDCLHWCMPGPVDTWNELLVEVIRRDFEG
ncbi:protein YLS7 [Lactuca sativa]|uniref:Trichome birefringence-like N-terminal domain-containing protein n=1 Tax=Lactuca sativa TaxID=4236 RepID=A0A9R1UT47_LACSA|nr:protein YLS7 [Lactuca sativa]KAJ0192356.1 hypothetical protein LSAT_V11C800392600 [Lactuca sativa]